MSHNPISQDLMHTFFAQAAEGPNRTAICSRDVTWTYNELARWVKRFASVVGSQPRNTAIAFCLQPGPERVATALGILNTGAAYVPLDPDAPAARLATLVADTDVREIIVDAATLPLVQQATSSLSVKIRTLHSLETAMADTPTDRDCPESDVSAMAYVMHTSGSTGVPKGVMVPHRAVLRLCVNTDFVQIAPGDRVAHFSNIAFDASTWEIWSALLNGGTLVLLDAGTLTQTDGLRDQLVQLGVSHLFITTGLFNLHVRQCPTIFEGLDTVLFGGELADAEVVGLLLASRKVGPRLLHVYGPTENTTFSTWWQVQPLTGSEVPIGRPISGTTCCVVDDELRPVIPGERGELLVGGTGLATGYLGAKDLTDARFVHVMGERRYRTGDRVKQDHNGELVFVGRVDNQVKIRGFRIEPEEVELAMLAHGQIQGVAVSPEREDSGTLRLVARVLGEDPPTISEIRSFLEERLPPYMVPARFLRVAHLPLKPNGKVDRALLNTLETTALPDAIARVAAGDPLEAKLLALFCSQLALDPEKTGVHHNFYALGGQSLIAAELIHQISKDLGYHLRMLDFVEQPTVAGLAQRARSLGLCPRPQIARTDRTRDLPLSPGQLQIWLHQKLSPDAVHYNEPIEVALPIALDVDVFTSAWRQVLSRHNALRLRFSEVDGRPVQHIVDTHGPLRHLDLRHLPAKQQDIRADAEGTQMAKTPFDLENEPLVRATLVQLDDDRYRLYLTGHHLVLDGVSMFQTVVPDLQLAYNALTTGQSPTFSEQTVRFQDLVLWQQRERFDTDALETWWADELAGLTALKLPQDHAPVPGDLSGGCEIFDLSAELRDAVVSLAKDHGSTAFSVLNATFELLLWRQTGQTDFAITTVRNARDLPGTERIVGDFLESVLLRARIDPQARFTDSLRKIATRNALAFDRASLPFERIARHLPDGGLDRVQVAFVLEPTHAEGGWQVGQHRVHSGHAKFPLTFELDEQANGWRCRAEYRSDRFEAGTIQRLIEQFRLILARVVARPTATLAQLVAVDAQERAQTLDPRHGLPIRYNTGTLHGQISRQVQRQPHAIAVVDSEQSVTFAELDAWANRLAHQLIDTLDPQPGQRIAVWCDRNVAHLVAQLAVLKVGAVYVPLAPKDPLDRVKFVAEDAGAVAILVDPAHAERGRETGLPAALVVTDCAEFPATTVRRTVSPQALAYVIYTSGTTGRPKGVAVSHANIVARCGCAPTWLGQEGGVVLHQFSLAFDGALLPTWLAMSAGLTCVLPTESALAEGPAVAELIAKHGVTHLTTTPTVLGLIADQLPKVRNILAGGEVLSRALANRLLTRCDHLFNGYGPTECTVLATAWQVQPEGHGRVVLGGILPNVRAYIVDKQGALLPEGAVGELWLGGQGVAQGYLNRDALTAERFVADTFSDIPGARLYKTGDRVRWRADGTLDYQGRADDQIKLNGNRIELGEIENALAALDGVRDAAVRVHPKTSRVLGYAVLSPGVQPPTVLAQLRARVPAFLVPASLTALPGLPRTANGKVDRDALPLPTNQACSDTALTDTEAQLARIFADVLGMSVGPDDDFFTLGGDSIQSLTVVARAREIDLEIGLRDLIEGRSVRGVLARKPAVLNPPTPYSFAPGSVPIPPVPAAIPLRKGGDQRPLFLAHPAGGISLVYQELVQHLPADLPVYGLSDPWFGGIERPIDDLDTLASVYINAMISVQPTGPYRLAGWSFGALLARVMARTLEDLGAVVELVVLFDDPGQEPDMPLEARISTATAEFFTDYSIADSGPQARWFRDELRFTYTLSHHAEPKPHAGHTVVVRAWNDLQADLIANPDTPQLLLGLDDSELRVSPGDHNGLFSAEHSPAAAAILTGLLDRLHTGQQPSADSVRLSNQLILDAVRTGQPERVAALQTLLSPVRKRALAVASPTAESPLSTGSSHVALLSRIWSEVTGTAAISVNQPMSTTGSSLDAIEFLARIEQQLGRTLPISKMLQGGSIAAIARALEQAPVRNALVCLEPGDAVQTPLFLVHPAGGSAFSYRELASRLDGRPVYGLEATVAYAGRSVEQMASEYVASVRAQQPHGPYLLGGWSLGGLIAAEMTRQFEDQGETVELLVLLDARPLHHEGQRTYLDHIIGDEVALLCLLARHLEHVANGPIDITPQRLRALPAHERMPEFLRALAEEGSFREASREGFVRRFVDDFRACNALFSKGNRSRDFAAPALLVRARIASVPYDGFPSLETPLSATQDNSYGWRALTDQGCCVVPLDCTHENIVFGDTVDRLAALLLSKLPSPKRTPRALPSIRTPSQEHHRMG